jgi:hypothetical protein
MLGWIAITAVLLVFGTYSIFALRPWRPSPRVQHVHPGLLFMYWILSWAMVIAAMGVAVVIVVCLVR